jgi:phosphonate transport system permease protein
MARFTPGERIARSMLYIVTAIAVVWSIRTIEIIPEFLYDAPEQTADLFRRMWPFDWAFYPKAVHDRADRDVPYRHARHHSGDGAGVAAVVSGGAQFHQQSGAQPDRAVHLRLVALGQFADLGAAVRGDLRARRAVGVLSIAFRSIGFVGKLFGEALEEAQQGPIEALTAAGAPRSMLLVKGYWPQVEPAFWSVALLRWDINIRESAVLGLVGAGGIGVALDAALNNLYWDQVGLILGVIFAVVIVTEIVTSTIRSRII